MVDEDIFDGIVDLGYGPVMILKRYRLLGVQAPKRGQKDITKLNNLSKT